MLDDCKNEHQFKMLLDDISLYSDYSLINTLLIRYQYPNFLSLKTKNAFKEMGYEVSSTATPIKILTPIHDEFVSIGNNVDEVIKNKKDLTQEELQMYQDPNNPYVTLHHKDFKGLRTTELFDVKDTNMDKVNYEQESLPALFYSSFDEIYNSLVKAIYCDGYKVRYEDIQQKVSLNKEENVISWKKGINNQIHLLLLLDTYTKDNSSNDMEKKLLEMTIARRIGIENKEIDFQEFSDWYKKQDMENVDHVLKLIVGKGKRFSDNFQRFYEKEMSENKELFSDEIDLYDDYNISL